VLGLVGVASANWGGRSSGMPPTAIVAAAGLLGHVFRKFPSMWNMNWMFARVKGGGRVHRMSWAAGGYDEYVETWGGWGSGPDEGPA